jgi:hypothetical protein
MAGTLPPSLVELWRDCELICLARKRNLDTQLRQTGATGNSFLIFRNRVKSGIEKYCFRSHANQIHNSVCLTRLRGARDRHERAVGCDGRGWRARRTRRKRTVKSCGSDAAVLALSPREAKLLEGDGGKRAVLREEHEVNRKAIAQGRPECSRCPVCSCAHLFAQIARGTAGAASTRSSLRPLILKRAKRNANSGAMRRENAKSYSVVITSRVRNCALARDSSDGIDRPRRTGCPPSRA